MKCHYCNMGFQSAYIKDTSIHKHFCNLICREGYYQWTIVMIIYSYRDYPPVPNWK